MSEIPNPSIINQQAKLPEGAVSDYMNHVITQSKEVTANPNERSKIVMDHLQGAIIRILGKEDGARTIQALEETRSDTYVGEDGKKHKWLESITRREGIRATVLRLHREIGDSLFSRSDLRYPDHDMTKPVFGNMDQLEGYLGVETQAESALTDAERASNWKDVLMVAVASYLDRPHLTYGPWNTQDNLSSDIEFVRREQIAWERAANNARIAGVDVELIARTAEFMKEQQNKEVKIGAAALRVSNYDSLFK